MMECMAVGGELAGVEADLEEMERRITAGSGLGRSNAINQNREWNKRSTWLRRRTVF